MIGIMKLFIVMLFRITISQNVEEFYELSAKDINGKEVEIDIHVSINLIT